MSSVRVPIVKIRLDPGAPERGGILVGDHAAGDDELVAGALLAQQLDHARKVLHVRRREAREADHVHVFLDGRRHHHLRASA